MSKIIKYPSIFLLFIVLQVGIGLLAYAIIQGPLLVDIQSYTNPSDPGFGPDIGALSTFITVIAFVVVIIAPFISLTIFEILLRLLGKVNKLFSTRFIQRFIIVALGCVIIALGYALITNINLAVMNRRSQEVDELLNNYDYQGETYTCDSNGDNCEFVSNSPAPKYEDPYRVVYLSEVRAGDIANFSVSQFIVNLGLGIGYTFANIAIFCVLEAIIKLFKLVLAKQKA